MKKAIYVILVTLFFLSSTSSLVAAAFTNLDFESPVLPLVPGLVPVTSALPGWHVYYGGQEQTDIRYNSATAGAPFIGLFSPPLGTIQGNYSVYFGPSAMTDVAISQSGLVPTDVRSLRFLGVTSSGPQPLPFSDLFGVSLNGERLAVVDLFDDPRFTIYGADVSSFAGLDANLTFTSFAVGQPNSAILDSISFSAEPVPEPSTLAIFGVCGLLGWAFVRRKARRR